MEEITKKQLFCEYYRCKIEETDRDWFDQVAGTQVINGAPVKVVGPSVSTSPKKLVKISISDAMLDNLINNTARELREKAIRESDPESYKRYMEYKLWLELQF